MIHIYALTDAAGLAPTLAGIDGARVEVHFGRAAAAILSVHDRAPEPTAERLLQHAAVVEAIHRSRAVLPARFGAGVVTLADVDRLLADEGLRPRLAGVRERVEIAVRVAAAGCRPVEPPPPVTPPAPRNGVEHLRAVAARHAAREVVRTEGAVAAAQVRARLEGLTAGTVVRPPGSPRVVWHAAVLVDRVALPAFEQTVTDLVAELEPDFTVLCTGPWPPYNFATVSGMETSS